MIKMIILLFVFAYTGFAQLLGPKLILQQTEHDFENILQGEEVSHTFVITNGGGDLLKITSVKPSCGCTAAMPEKNELAPGESTNLVVKFNSTGRYGKQKKIVRIESNDSENPQALVTIKGVVVLPEEEASAYPVINFIETDHDFGEVDEGKVFDYIFDFENTGTARLKIKNVRTSCGCTAALVSSDVIEPGKNGTLKVELDTSNREGKMNRTITITSNDPQNPEIVLNVTANIIQ
jgi:hypothetical protein